MARSDLLIKILKAARIGDQALLRRSAEALIAEERAQHHHVLAERLEESLDQTPLSQPLPFPPARAPEGIQEPFVHEITPRRGLGDLILTPSLRETCVTFVEEQQRAGILRAYNLEPRHRILLVGPPGNGKTTLAEAIAFELALPLYTVRYEGVIASYLGETAARVSRLFDFTRTRNCVLFFDEFDAIAKERGDPHDTGEVKRVVSSLLLQVDSLPSHVIVVAATNHAELLDSAVWRRFQIRAVLKPPTLRQRREVLERLTGFLGGGVSTTEIARKLVGASFAEIVEFISDVERRHVLGLPDSTPRSAVTATLQEWTMRAKPRTAVPDPDDGR
jgi:hypothetical protein